MDATEDILVDINGLYVNFYTYQGVVQAIEGVDLQIRRGETLGLVGETGCGKSVTASTIMKLILSPPGKIEAGNVFFLEPADVRAKRVQYLSKAQAWWDALPPEKKRGMLASKGIRFTGFKKRVKKLTSAEIKKLSMPQRVPSNVAKWYMADIAKKIPREDRTTLDALWNSYDLLTKRNEYMQKIRGKWISMIFQEPTSALNPVFTSGFQIAEVVLQHRKGDMALRASKRIQSELKPFKKPRKERIEDARQWYSKLSDNDRKRMVAAYRSPVSRFRARGSRVTPGKIAKTVAPQEIPPRLAKAYLRKKRRRPMMLTSRRGVKAGGSKPTIVSTSRCSICSSEVEPTDTWCDKCGSKFYGPFSWLMRLTALDTNQRMLQFIIKKPETKETFTRRIPLLNRYRKDLYDEAFREAVKMLEVVRIPDPRGVADRYPYELSGGMQQRVMIAIALACNPKLLIADEPTTALDVTIQGQILKLMRDLKDVYGSSILLITHNLGVVAEMCDRVGVMYAGSMAEIGSAKDIYKRPLHPYTMGLMKSVPSIQGDVEKLYTIRGSVPNLIYPPSGCRFHPRCDFAKGYCTKVKPEITEIEPGHSAACHMVAGVKGYAESESFK
jgi:oligopeptide/dipeptide ABC transporter ATP-binding protein